MGLGVAISLALGVIFAVLYYKAQQNLFQGGQAQVRRVGGEEGAPRASVQYCCHPMLGHAAPTSCSIQSILIPPRPSTLCSQFIFKGVVAWIACIFITFLAFAMLRYKGWEDKWARKLAIVKASNCCDCSSSSR